MTTIGERLRQSRLAAKHTLIDAAAVSGVSKQAISQIERGITRKPEAETLEPLCRAFGVSLHWLLSGQNQITEISANGLRSIERDLLQAFRELPLRTQKVIVQMVAGLSGREP